jgi:hypothetical protein
MLKEEKEYNRPRSFGKIKFIDGLIILVIFTHFKNVTVLFQFKMKPQLHYAEDDCPVSISNNFPKDDELHFEIEMIDFFKAKVSLSNFNSLSC